MKREEILEYAESWIISAENHKSEEMEIRCLRIADTWIRLAEEVRKGSAPASLDVN